MLDLTDLFRANDQKMPDAMVTEMHRHLEGAVTTVETGMMFGLRSKAAEVAPMLPDAVDTLGYGYCWRVIELHPGLAGPALVENGTAMFSGIVVNYVSSPVDYGTLKKKT